MITWPVAVVICFSILFLYGVVDTWLKCPYFEKRVGSLVIKMRGPEARVAMEHYNSMTVVGFGDAIDEASGEREHLDARTYPEFESFDPLITPVEFRELRARGFGPGSSGESIREALRKFRASIDGKVGG